MNKTVNKTHTNLAFTDASCAVIAVTVNAHMLRNGIATCTCNKRILVLGATFLAPLVKRVAMQF